MVSVQDKSFVLLFLEPWNVQAPSKKAGKKGGAPTSKKAGGAAGKVAKVRTSLTRFAIIGIALE